MYHKKIIRLEESNKGFLVKYETIRGLQTSPKNDKLVLDAEDPHQSFNKDKVLSKKVPKVKKINKLTNSGITSSNYSFERNSSRWKDNLTKNIVKKTKIARIKLI